MTKRRIDTGAGLAGHRVRGGGRLGCAPPRPVVSSRRMAGWLATVTLTGLAGLGTAFAQPPLAASDWLGQGATAPPARESSAWRPGLPVPGDAVRPSVHDTRPRPRPEASPGPATIGVSRIDGPDSDAAGLISADEAGLKVDFWAGTDLPEALTALAGPAPRLPVLDQAYRRLLVAQIDPPARADGQEGRLILARADTLMAMGAPDEAAALLDAAGVMTAPLFARRMDAALLLGDERRVCSTVLGQPGLAPSLAERIYCLARDGDWPAARLALSGADLGGGIGSEMQPLLAAFLDDTQVDEGVHLTPPDPITPLAFRLMEAVGQPLPTSELPIAYAMSDLRPNSGWKPRIEAAERLARAGSLGPRQLRGIYSEQPPAASGGVWDRVGAIQRLEAALSQGTNDAVLTALGPADAAMRAGGLWAEFAQMFVAPLAAMMADDAGLDGAGSDFGSPAELIENLVLAGGDRDARTMLARRSAPRSADRRWLFALALDGALPVDAMPMDEPGASLTQAFHVQVAPPAGPAGPAYLSALRDLDSGREGDLHRAAQGIAALRGLGHERLARDAVLQLLLMPETRGE